MSSLGIGLTNWSRELVEPDDPALDAIRDRSAIAVQAERQRQAEAARAARLRQAHERTLPARRAEAMRLGATPEELARLESPDGSSAAPRTLATLPEAAGDAPAARSTLATQADAMDQREAEYMKDPDAWERKRMAADPVSGELRYSVGGGPMRSYNVGANRTDVTGDPDLARYRDDKVFGKDVGTRKGGGSVSIMGGLDDPMKDENYRNYLRGRGRLGEALAEEANIARAAAFAADPFADQTAVLKRGEALERAKTRSGELVRRAYLAQAQEEAEAFNEASELIRRSQLPQEDKDERLQAAQERYDQRKSMLMQAFGFGGRLSSQSIYEG